MSALVLLAVALFGAIGTGVISAFLSDTHVDVERRLAEAEAECARTEMVIDRLTRAMDGFARIDQERPAPVCGDMLATTGEVCDLEPGHVGVHSRDDHEWWGNARFDGFAPCVCGHVHWVQCWECTCTTYEPDDGTDQVGYWPTGAYARDVYHYESAMAERGDVSL